MSKYKAFKQTMYTAVPCTNWLSDRELAKCSKTASDLYARVLLQQRLIDSNACIAVRQIRTKKQFKYEFVLDSHSYSSENEIYRIVAKIITDFEDKVIARVVYDNA